MNRGILHRRSGLARRPTLDAYQYRGNGVNCSSIGKGELFVHGGSRPTLLWLASGGGLWDL